tara:strand:- start:383 stop:586 length:204 start_codon:yes stop_codon:yes gene_type:complete
MSTLLEIIFNHIENWKRFWFGLIFFGSIFNALAEKSTYLSSVTNICLIAFGLGACMGLVAKYRGEWL